MKSFSSKNSAGILGLGVHLPEQVRTNDWWPEATVERWQERRANRVMQARDEDFLDEASQPGALRILKELARLQDDPFRGSVERRILPEHLPASEMSEKAAAAAILDAKLDPSEIDVLIDYCALPDKLVIPNAFVVHKAIGLSNRCMSMSIDVGCNSFLTQLALANDLIAGGKFRYILCVQTFCIARLCPSDQPYSPWYGDGASAVVVGPVGGDFGILGQGHKTDSSLYDAMGATVPGARWYDEGRIVLFPQDPACARRLVLGIADRGLEMVSSALVAANVCAEDIRYYGGNPATAWMANMTRDYIGLHNAQTVNTFPWAGNVGAVNVPLVLSVGRKEGLLSSGDLVAVYTGGVGAGFAGMVMRWGKA